MWVLLLSPALYLSLWSGAEVFSAVVEVEVDVGVWIEAWQRWLEEENANSGKGDMGWAAAGQNW